MLSRLKQSLQNLEDIISGKSRSAVLAGPRSKKVYEDNDDTKELSNRELLQQQQATIQRHDHQLDGILEGLGKLKEMRYVATPCML